MLKNTSIGFFAFSSSMKVLAGKIFCSVWEITIWTSVTVVSEEKFAHFGRIWIWLRIYCWLHLLRSLRLLLFENSWLLSKKLITLGRIQFLLKFFVSKILSNQKFLLWGNRNFISFSLKIIGVFLTFLSFEDLIHWVIWTVFILGWFSPFRLRKS